MDDGDNENASAGGTSARNRIRTSLRQKLAEAQHQPTFCPPASILRLTYLLSAFALFSPFIFCPQSFFILVLVSFVPALHSSLVGGLFRPLFLAFLFFFSSLFANNTTPSPLIQPLSLLLARLFDGSASSNEPAAAPLPENIGTLLLFCHFGHLLVVAVVLSCCRRCRKSCLLRSSADTFYPVSPFPT